MATLAQKKQPQSFREWCKQKSLLPSETQDTIDVLLTKAGTRNCQQAEFKLRTTKKLDLTDNRISDIQLLASLTELTELDRVNLFRFESDLLLALYRVTIG